MRKESVPDGAIYDPVATRGQDMLDQPNDVPDIETHLATELRQQYEPTLAQNPARWGAAVKRGVMRTFVGSAATLVYEELARQILPIVSQGQALVPEQLPPSRPLYSETPLAPLVYRGYAHDFMRTGMSWLSDAASAVYDRAAAPDGRYRSILEGLARSTRDWCLYVAEDPQARVPWQGDSPRPPDELRKAQFETIARHAGLNLRHLVLFDNVKVAQEMLLQWGLGYSREEGRFPSTEELTATALGHTSLMSRAAALSTMPFMPMAHDNPSGLSFHDYELSHLDSVEALFPGRESIFMKKEGTYTYRHGPLQKKPLLMIQNCPGARTYRSGEPSGEDAIEGLFSLVGQRSGVPFPRRGDGTFTTVSGVLAFGGFLASETIYAAWPAQDH
jgi:hypothetical protein